MSVMQRSRSGLSEPRLKYYLQRAKEIAGLDEEAAFLEIDRLISELVNERFDDDRAVEVAYQRRRARGEVDRFLREADQVARSVAASEPRAFWDSRELLRRFEAAVTRWDVGTTDELGKELDRLSDHLKELSKQSEANQYRRTIQDSENRPIYNVSVARGIISELTDARRHLSDEGLLTPDLANALSRSMKRAAAYRARKAYRDSKVAAAGGRNAKARRLLAEANEMLRQDWSMAFPEQPPPPIDSLDETAA